MAASRRRPALKDADAFGTPTIEAQFFDHPQFKRLETGGLEKHDGMIAQGVELVKRLAC